MCPDRKLQWFKDRDYTRPTLNYIKDLVIARFKDGYDTGTGGGLQAAVRSHIFSICFQFSSVCHCFRGQAALQ